MTPSCPLMAWPRSDESPGMLPIAINSLSSLDGWGPGSALPWISALLLGFDVRLSAVLLPILLKQQGARSPCDSLLDEEQPLESLLPTSRALSGSRRGGDPLGRIFGPIVEVVSGKVPAPPSAPVSRRSCRYVGPAVDFVPCGPSFPSNSRFRKTSIRDSISRVTTFG